MTDLIELTDMERQVLAAVADGGHGVASGSIARSLGFTRQRVTRLAADLESFGLMTARRLPKQVSYTVTGEGRRYLP